MHKERRIMEEEEKINRSRCEVQLDSKLSFMKMKFKSMGIY